MSQSDAVLEPFSKNDFATQVTFSVPRYMPCLEELETVAACLILEAASEGDEGMRGVMSVIRNRAHGLPELFKPVVLKPMQFSALNGVTAGREELSHCVWRAKNDRMWSTAFSLVKEAQGESWRDITGGATHYTRSDETVRWTRTLRKTATIKHHSFYR
jgi:spore germination cell wall hydrolase CwlJ-like protein